MAARTKDSSADLRFGALDSPTRREILLILDRGLVSEKRDGRTIRYRSTPEPLADAASWLSPFETFWRSRLKDLNSTLDNLKDTRCQQL